MEASELKRISRFRSLACCRSTRRNGPDVLRMLSLAAKKLNLLRRKWNGGPDEGRQFGHRRSQQGWSESLRSAWACSAWGIVSVRHPRAEFLGFEREPASQLCRSCIHVLVRHAVPIGCLLLSGLNGALSKYVAKIDRCGQRRGCRSSCEHSVSPAQRRRRTVPIQLQLVCSPLTLLFSVRTPGGTLR